MEKLKFSTNIDASREKVWKVLWDDATYRQWTKAFSEESFARSDWEEGGRIEFLDGDRGGMYSRIAKKIPFEFMSFEHLGSIKDGKDVPFAGEMESWSGTREDYKLTESGGSTELTVETDVVEEFKDFIVEKFPIALAKVKELSED